MKREKREERRERERERGRERGREGEGERCVTVSSQYLSMLVFSSTLALLIVTIHLPPFLLAASSHEGSMFSLNSE